MEMTRDAVEYHATTTTGPTNRAGTSPGTRGGELTEAGRAA
ncbi:hypothetical protein [Streptomyces sp. ALI-76-A]|nr:hypothetical protein [Streptomyces sp. ALI-76-A]MDL5204219.1 hypothetical protein [Streptomyces sp. ALI-76-A]